MNKKNKMFIGIGVLMLIVVGGLFFTGEFQYAQQSDIQAYDDRIEITYQIRGGGLTTNCPTGEVTSLGSWATVDSWSANVLDSNAQISSSIVSSGCSSPPCLQITWSDVEKCKTGNDYYANVLVVGTYGTDPTCTNGQSVGDTWCVSDNLYKCVIAGSSGTFIEACSGTCEEYTTSAQCVGETDECSEGNLQCDDTIKQVCSDGQWTTIGSCPIGTTCFCDNLSGPIGCEAIETTDCTQGEKRCSNNNLEICSTVGTWIVDVICSDTEECQVEIPYCTQVEPTCEPGAILEQGCDNNIITTVKCDTTGMGEIAIDNACEDDTVCSEWTVNDGSTLWTCSADNTNPINNDDGGDADSQCIDKPINPCLGAIWYSYPTCTYDTSKCLTENINTTTTEDDKQDYCTDNFGEFSYYAGENKCECNEGYKFDGNLCTVGGTIGDLGQIGDVLSDLFDAETLTEHPEYIIGIIILLGAIAGGTFLVYKKVKKK